MPPREATALPFLLATTRTVRVPYADARKQRFAVEPVNVKTIEVKE